MATFTDEQIQRFQQLGYLPTDDDHVLLPPDYHTGTNEQQPVWYRCHRDYTDMTYVSLQEVLQQLPPQLHATARRLHHG